MATKNEMIAAVKAHANANYEKGGWDILVECWEDNEILEEIGECTTVAGAIAKCAKTLHIVDEHRREIQSEVF